MTKFAERLKELRAKKGLTQEDLGKLFCVTQRAASNWENGTCEPNSSTFIILADYFNVSTDYLLGRDTVLNSQENKKELSFALLEEIPSAVTKVLDEAHELLELLPRINKNHEADINTLVFGLMPSLSELIDTDSLKAQNAALVAVLKKHIDLQRVLLIEIAQKAEEAIHQLKR